MQQSVTFEELFARLSWKPIHNCPGRFTLLGGLSRLKPVEIIEKDLPVFEFRIDAVPDTILIVKFINGGLISYRKNDGSFLHTLNNTDGFTRKLKQLKIQFTGDLIG